MAIEAPGAAPMESMGAQLNRMAGTAPEKNLFEPKDKMGKDAFLKMFTEQLKNQDPLNPMHNEQFSQQMATFSQLEQQIQTNKNLEKMIQQQSNMQMAALQLVGRNISADRAAVYHDKEKPSVINFKLPADANELKVQITDQEGQVIKSINIGSRQQGDVQTKWDGLNEEGRPMETGRYSYKIVAKGVDNKDMPITTRVDGRVNGVTTDKGVTFLLVGDQKIGLSDVENIKEGTGDDKNAAAPVAVPLFGQAPAAPIAENQPVNLPQISVGGDEISAGTKPEEPTVRGETPAENTPVNGRATLTEDAMPIFFR